MPRVGGSGYFASFGDTASASPTRMGGAVGSGSAPMGQFIQATLGVPIVFRHYVGEEVDDLVVGKPDAFVFPNGFNHGRLLIQPEIPVEPSPGSFDRAQLPQMFKMLVVHKKFKAAFVLAGSPRVQGYWTYPAESVPWAASARPCPSDLDRIVTHGPPAKDQIPLFTAPDCLTSGAIMSVEMGGAVLNGVVQSHMPLQALVQITSLGNVDRHPGPVFGHPCVDVKTGQRPERSVQ
ncbi:hypothetical protein SBV1_1610005 [Verrucomicrobia bacterium]|nr:hypothetical protein SBV1_1610005 [Verrucomicrobiota bacterium]